MILLFVVNNLKMRGLLIYIVQCFKKEKLTLTIKNKNRNQSIPMYTKFVGQKMVTYLFIYHNAKGGYIVSYKKEKLTFFLYINSIQVYFFFKVPCIPPFVVQ